ncbi:60S ribosomal protein L7a [Plecturocebus cupreus]
MDYLSSLLPKMPNGKKAKGKMAPASAVFKKQEAKKVVNSLFEKRPKNFANGQDIQPKRTSLALSNSTAISGFSGKGLSPMSS